MLQEEKFQAPRFPKKELKEWVKKKESWDHDDWTNLLWGLREEGFALYTDSPTGQEMIGRFVETEKRKIQ